jgi:hypothetical protein
MGGLLSILIPSIVPAVTDAFRGIVAKFTGGAGGNPQNVSERIQLMNAETERLKALAEIDKPSGETSQWVTDTRAIYRYGFVTMVWIVAAFSLFTPEIPEAMKLVLLDMSGACGSFIIGERMYFNLKSGGVK